MHHEPQAGVAERVQNWFDHLRQPQPANYWSDHNFERITLWLQMEKFLSDQSRSGRTVSDASIKRLLQQLVYTAIQALNLVSAIPFIFRTPPPPPPPLYKRVCKKNIILGFDFDPSDWPMENTLNRTQKSPLPKLQLSVSFQLKRTSYC